MNGLQKYSRTFLLLILILGGWLRFHHLSETSFSNDELSALTRARYDSFHDLVDKGIKTDGHPALVETMLWVIVHTTNDNVFTIRFLFAVASIISIFLVFLLARRWFGSATALLSAAALATLQFPLLYSQLARPYSIGLMFVLATAYLWTEIIAPHPQPFSKGEGSKQQPSKLWVGICYTLCASACLWTHYFSFLVAVVMGISGLFFLSRTNYRQYLFCNVIVALLFIPHLSITKAQFAFGGLGWLSPPASTFLSDFIHYGFNDSNFIFYLFAAIFILSVIFYSRRYRWSKFHSLCLIWYLIPFMVGYYYSIHKAPVLQYSVLLFSFPFILIFIFSFIKDKWMNKTVLTLLILIVVATCTYSTVAEKKYYSTTHFAVFKELAQKVIEWNKKYGEKNITTTFTLNSPEYINYYFRKLNSNPSVSFYTSDERADLGKYSLLLDTTTTEYFAYAWTNSAHQYETIELIQEKYPAIVERDTFLNSEITLFKKGVNPMPSRIISSNDLEHNNWGKETEIQNHDLSHSPSSSQRIDPAVEYSITYRSSTSDLKIKAGDVIKSEVWFNTPDTVGEATLVMSIGKKGETPLWWGMPLKIFFVEKNRWQRAILRVPLNTVPEGELAIYVWNPNKKIFYIDDFKISVEEKNPNYRPD